MFFFGYASNLTTMKNTFLACLLFVNFNATAESLTEMRARAEQGHAEAQYLLARCYALGEGVPKDAVEAVKWYRRAAEQEPKAASIDLSSESIAMAQCCLGASYALGKGVPKDAVEAVKWYRKAAEQQLAHAQYLLGLSYATGDGVARNIAESVKWYRSAAEQGHAGAQYRLGLFYGIGKGVPKDAVEAYKWLNLSAAQGDEQAAKFRSDFEGTMTPSEISDAQRLSREWKPLKRPAHPNLPH